MIRRHPCMATVNLTCTTCEAGNPCASCRSIAKALRAAGHSITQSTRYQALRAATVGAYGFGACILPVARHERAVIDAAVALLNRTRVALVVEPGALAEASLPKEFAVIEKADWRQQSFPTDWIGAAPAPEPGVSDETGLLPELAPPPTDVDSARRRLKSVAARAQRELSAAGFPGDVRLDLLATLEDELAWAKMSAGCFGLVLVHLASAGDSTADVRETEGALAFLKQRIGEVVRASDPVCVSRDSLLVIFAETTLDQTEVAAARMKKSLRKAVKEAAGDQMSASALRRVTLGISVYPTHGTTRAALLARATAAASPL